MSVYHRIAPRDSAYFMNYKHLTHKWSNKLRDHSEASQNTNRIVRGASNDLSMLTLSLETTSVNQRARPRAVLLKHTSNQRWERELDWGQTTVYRRMGPRTL